MKRLLSWFRRPSRRPPASAHPRRPARPQLEQLDDRLVPSTAGPSSAISTDHTFYVQGKASYGPSFEFSHRQLERARCLRRA
jgi:hypothetical protein